MAQRRRPLPRLHDRARTVLDSAGRCSTMLYDHTLGATHMQRAAELDGAVVLTEWRPFVHCVEQ